MRPSRYNVVIERGELTWIHNGVSGQVFSLPTDDWSDALAFLEGDHARMPAVETLRDLTVARMLVNDDQDEVATLERRFRAGTSDRSAFALTIVTSLGCNFDCPYCFENKPPAILDAETEALLLEVLDAQLDTIKLFDVTWYGGEPLLAQDRIDRLSEAFLERTGAAGVTYSASIVTNGYLLTPDVARRLKALKVKRAQITLDGPAETHDLMRPLRNGRGTFDVILENVVACADLIPISIRVNLDASNVGESVRLLDVLVDRGLAGRVTVNPGHIVAYPDQAGAPSETYQAQCFTLPEFAEVERDFLAAAYERGLAKPRLPGPIASPCTAIRSNDLIVGARGELYKCYDNGGDPREVIGHLRSWRDPNDRVLKWLRYDPFADEGCRSCIALPTCMGGCAHHQMTDPGDAKCSTFRLTHRRQVEEYADAAEAGAVRGFVSLPIVAVT
jgi:uncharacterized protein